MKILLIGGAGFIGSRTAIRLLEAGHDPVVMDSFDTQIHGEGGLEHVEELRRLMPVVTGDTRNRDSLDQCLRECDAVYYFPASTGTGQSMYRIGEYCDVNVRGAGVFADALLAHRSRISRVVVSSSRAVYGEGAALCPEHGRVFPRSRKAIDLDAGRFEAFCPHCAKPVQALPSLEDDAYGPVSIYGITKLAQEMVVANAAGSAGISTVVFRYQNVYGPGQSLKNPYTGILSIFTQLLLAGEKINVFEDGFPTRDFVHVDDVVEYNVRALTAGLSAPAVLNVGTGIRSTIFDLIQAMGKALGLDPRYAVSGDYRLGDIRHAVADTKRLFDTFGRLEFKNLDDGVMDFASWVASQKLEGSANNSFRKSLDEMRGAGLLRTAAGL
jgi:dTDP-L-rhamnose 4-epimerase